MRIISWNVNGIRAAIRKGIDEFIEKLKPDVLMLQEIRCLEEQLPKNWKPPLNMNYIWPKYITSAVGCFYILSICVYKF